MPMEARVAGTSELDKVMSNEMHSQCRECCERSGEKVIEVHIYPLGYRRESTASTAGCTTYENVSEESRVQLSKIRQGDAVSGPCMGHSIYRAV